MLRTHAVLAFRDLLEVLRCADAWTGHATRLEVRSVLVRGQEGAWKHYSTVLKTVPASGRLPAVVDVEMAGARLISRTVRMDSLGEIDHLMRLLASWRTVVNASSGFAFEVQGAPTHLPGGSEWDDSPCWVIRLREEVPNEPAHAALPQGPFLSPESPVFAESLEELAQQWIGHAFDGSPTHTYRAVVVDRRARIVGLSVAEGPVIAVQVDAHVGEPILCMAVGRDRTGAPHRQRGEVVNGICKLSFPGSLSFVDVWLVGPDHDWLDHYREGPGYSNLGTLFLSGLGDSRDPAFLDLRGALESGEGESTEYKEWVLASRRDGKTKEILKTACAFANRSGGSIWIGVNKEGVVTGLRKQLEREYGPRVKGSFEDLTSAYAKDISAILSEGVDPRLQFSCEWVSYAQHDVLRVVVPLLESKGFSLAEDGEAFRRHGSTNRRLRPADVIDWLKSGG